MKLKPCASWLVCAALIGLLLLLTPARTGAQNDLAIIPVNRIMWAVKRANVRSGMGTTFAKVGLLEVGEQVRVTGVGPGGEWLRIEWPNGRSAFVYAPLLAAAPPQSTPASTAHAGRQVLTYTNARYEGEIRDGKPHGQGTKTYSNGDRYEGKWRDGNEHGRGTYTWTNGNRYEGEWHDGKRHGLGIFTWSDGDHYKGDYVDGKRTGQGTYTWPDGAYYEGGFVNGKRTGHGRYVQANGEAVEGEWKDDDLVRRSEVASVRLQQRSEQAAAPETGPGTLGGYSSRRGRRAHVLRL